MMKFNYKGKEYQVEEPTVEMWSKLTLLQEWTDEREFCLKLLSFITGLTEEDIENSDYMEVVKLSTEISTFLNKMGISSTTSSVSTIKTTDFLIYPI